MTMMLKEISVKGYKSIKALEQFELRQLNVMIGANGAGKSNLIGLFKLLNNMTFGTDNLQNYIALEGGGNSILHDGADVTPQINLELEFGNSSASNEYKCRLFHAAPDTIIFANEAIRYSDTSYGQKADWESLGSGQWESNLHRASDDGHKTARFILHLLKNCTVYQFHNTSDKSRIRLKQPINDGWRLKSDGANLAPFLYQLQQNEPRYYRRIVDTIQQIAPFFQDFVLEPQYDMLLLQWREKNSDMLFSANQASDGTLRTMALVSLLLQPKDRLPNLLILDEPELGLHPRAIDILSGMIHRVSHSSQIILATQSPELLNYFEPEDIVVVDRPGRASTYSRLNADDLKEWLEEYTMGDLWKKNIMGGNPR